MAQKYFIKLTFVNNEVRINILYGSKLKSNNVIIVI